MNFGLILAMAALLDIPFSRLLRRNDHMPRRFTLRFGDIRIHAMTGAIDAMLMVSRHGRDTNYDL
jgi:hypothetical protein